MQDSPGTGVRVETQGIVLSVQCSPVPCQGSVEEARYEDCTKYTCKKLTKKDAIWVQSPAM